MLNTMKDAFSTTLHNGATSLAGTLIPTINAKATKEDAGQLFDNAKSTFSDVAHLHVKDALIDSGKTAKEAASTALNAYGTATTLGNDFLAAASFIPGAAVVTVPLLAVNASTGAALSLAGKQLKLGGDTLLDMTKKIRSSIPG